MQKDSADKMQGYLDTLHRGLKKAGNG